MIAVLITTVVLGVWGTGIALAAGVLLYSVSLLPGGETLALGAAVALVTAAAAGKLFSSMLPELKKGIPLELVTVTAVGGILLSSTSVLVLGKEWAAYSVAVLIGRAITALAALGVIFFGIAAGTEVGLRWIEVTGVKNIDLPWAALRMSALLFIVAAGATLMIQFVGHEVFGV